MNMCVRMITVACLASLLLAGCQSRGTRWEPVVDRQGLDETQYRQDLSECQAYAQQGSSTAAGAGRRAASGAAVGGAVGGILGDSTRAATRGAGVGGVLGGTRGARAARAEQEGIIRNCLRGRGYRVLN